MTKFLFIVHVEERTKDGGEIRGREEEAQGVGYPEEGNPFKALQEGP